MSKIETATFDAPAFWAPALINGDESMFHLDPESDNEFQEWCKKNEKCLWVVECSEDPHDGQFNGKLCELLTYTYHIKKRIRY